jgi:predicted DCC family thiol-disulfide oxidoreductase YuxK
MVIEKNCTNVLYDGSCLLCALEINQYRKIIPDSPIHWVDVTSPEFTAPLGQTKASLMQRFHVVQPDGELISGAAAFVSVWEKLPKFRYLAALSKLPGMLNAMEFGYVNFLKIRPRLQAFLVKK